MNLFSVLLQHSVLERVELSFMVKDLIGMVFTDQVTVFVELMLVI